MTKTAAIVIDSGPQNTVRFGAGPLRFGSQVVARRIDVFGSFRAVMAGRIGTWVARDCHIRASYPCRGRSRRCVDGCSPQRRRQFQSQIGRTSLPVRSDRGSPPRQVESATPDWLMMSNDQVAVILSLRNDVARAISANQGAITASLPALRQLQDMHGQDLRSGGPSSRAH